MRTLLKWLPPVAIAVVIVVAGDDFTAGSSLASMGCVGNGFAAGRMRAMDERRLIRLYEDTQAFVAAQPSPTSWGVVPGDELPSVFSGLHAQYATIVDDDVMFMLSGCFDDKVFLLVDRDDDARSGQIVLAPGEGRANETLWQRRSAPAQLR